MRRSRSMCVVGVMLVVVPVSAGAITPPGSNGVAKDPGFVIQLPVQEGMSVTLNSGTGYHTATHRNIQNPPGGSDYFSLDFFNANAPDRSFDVFPIAPGVVEYAGPTSGTYAGCPAGSTTGTPGYGNIVLIRHLNGYHSLYAHLESWLVAQNQTVDTSSSIGRAGLSGRCTTDLDQLHLHLSVYQDQPGNPVVFNQPNNGLWPSGGAAVVPEPFAHCTMRKNDATGAHDGKGCFDLDATSPNHYRFVHERLAPAAITDGNGQLHAFVVGADGRLYFKALDCGNGGWASLWAAMPHPSASGFRWVHVPALVLDADGKINVMMRGADGLLYHSVEKDPQVHTWSDWRAFPSSTGVGAPTAFLANQSGTPTLTVVARGLGPDFTLGLANILATQTDLQAPGTWVATVPWWTLRKTEGDPVAVMGLSPEVYVQLDDYQLYRTRMTELGAWSDFELMYSGPIVGGIGATSHLAYTGGTMADPTIFVRSAADTLVELRPDTSGVPSVTNLPITRDPAAGDLGDTVTALTRQTGPDKVGDGAVLFANTGTTTWTGWDTSAMGLMFHSNLGVARTSSGDSAIFGWDSVWAGDNESSPSTTPHSTNVYYVPFTSRGAGGPVSLGAPDPASLGTQPAGCSARAATPALGTPTVAPDATATPQGLVAPLGATPLLTSTLQWTFHGGNLPEPAGTWVFRDRTTRSDPAPVLDLLGTVFRGQPKVFRHQGVLPETEYCYLLRSFLSPTNTSRDSGTQCIRTLAAPANLGLAVAGTQLTLSWRDNSAYESNYLVQRRLKAETTWQDLTKLQKGTQSYVTAYSPGSTYCYRVFATNRDGSSLPSNEACTGSGRVLLSEGLGSGTASTAVADVLRQQLPAYQFTQIAREPTATDLAGADILVLILPDSSSQLAAVSSFVSNGGSLLIVGEYGSWVAGHAPGVPAYARAFGFTLGGTGYASGCSQGNYASVVNAVFGLPLGTPVYVAATDSISGGTAVLSIGAWPPVFNVTAYGRGRVAISGDSNIWGGCGYPNAAFTRGLFSWLSGALSGPNLVAAGMSGILPQSTAQPPSSTALRGTITRVQGPRELQLHDGSGRLYRVVLDESGIVCRREASDARCIDASWKALAPGAAVLVEGTASADGRTFEARTISLSSAGW